MSDMFSVIERYWEYTWWDMPAQNGLVANSYAIFALWNFIWVVVSNIFYFHPYLGKIPILTNIFQRGWNHQPAMMYKKNHPRWTARCWWPESCGMPKLFCHSGVKNWKIWANILQRNLGSNKIVTWLVFLCLPKSAVAEIVWFHFLTSILKRYLEDRGVVFLRMLMWWTCVSARTLNNNQGGGIADV